MNKKIKQLTTFLNNNKKSILLGIVTLVAVPVLIHTFENIVDSFFSKTENPELDVDYIKGFPGIEQTNKPDSLEFYLPIKTIGDAIACNIRGSLTLIRVDEGKFTVIATKENNGFNPTEKIYKDQAYSFRYNMNPRYQTDTTLICSEIQYENKDGKQMPPFRSIFLLTKETDRSTLAVNNDQYQAVDKFLKLYHIW